MFIRRVRRVGRRVVCLFVVKVSGFFILDRVEE